MQEQSVGDGAAFEYPSSHWQNHKPVDVSLMTNVSFFTLVFGFFLSQAFSKLLKIKECRLTSANC